MGAAEYRDPENTYGLPRAVECPFCGGTDTQLETPFGSVLSVAQYYCRHCRTIFEWVKRRKPRTQSNDGTQGEEKADEAGGETASRSGQRRDHG